MSALPTQPNWAIQFRSAFHIRNPRNFLYTTLRVTTGINFYKLYLSVFKPRLSKVSVVELDPWLGAMWLLFRQAADPILSITEKHHV